MQTNLVTKKKKLRASQLIPTDAQAQKILSLRAQQMAKQILKSKTQDVFIEYVHFILSRNESYGIPFMKIEEVIEKPAITLF